MIPIPAHTLQRIASAERLLVISDFDGTLAEFSTDPMNVPINQAGMAALSALATMPNTRAGLLSGRDLESLKTISGADSDSGSDSGGGLVLCGSHGAEEEGVGLELSHAQQETLEQVTAALNELVAGTEAHVEHKPLHRVLHMITLRDDAATTAALTEAALALQIPGTVTKQGHFIVEIGVSQATKGSWLRQAIERFGADATVFLGDDRTDEDGFAVLGPQDLGVKVGAGETLANVRVANPSEVGELLQALAKARAEAQR
ncbi:trehalose-phosphatase [Corynebacterium sp. 153RC1]|uniref:trehalose-phosphatase n=1 Tax=unclassified Corynebacterium TaxID=2624378 RepID=UPI00211B85A4|nr:MULTISPECIES: trehalose-phosphatase [unclassified Corynebacterium]MCQ9371481.1 trehalose-phosphatase [Corynebacterium sp. 35RC1]MCQ9353061.1 trehalose-phosphatase [Corynebacterium sp. 209RC1]MCQ9355265.1 trehalose-phosphatase [Corynebacterium sp. 1222RC1]MCQ9357561.1 trehalose-phosphatase [Corynebacterium sp. 122RC1]MCQ9359138.1 trehalose-phosphatase [Corynebacterium sp. 142RC1]